MGFLNFNDLFAHGVGDPLEAPPLARFNLLMAQTQREIALLNADMVGAQAYLGQCGRGRVASAPTRGERRQFRDLIETSPQPYLIIDPRPGLHIVDFNDSYAQIALSARRRIAGQKLFDVFPDNPEHPDADGVCNLYESLKRCALTARAHKMAVQRYDIQDENGRFVERRWLPRNTPIVDDEGRVVFLVHHVAAALV